MGVVFSICLFWHSLTLFINQCQYLQKPTADMSFQQPSENLQRVAMHEVRERLEPFVEPFKKRAAVELEVLYGKPFVEIIHAVLRRQFHNWQPKSGLI